MDLLDEILDLANELTKEDTFLSLTGKPIKKETEKIWLKNILKEVKSKKTFLIWAVDGKKIVGTCDLRAGGTRDAHVCSLGLMVRKAYRQEGIGKFMFEFILKKAKELNYKIAKLDVFNDNEIAKGMYAKYGFKEFARLPNGFCRKSKFSDALQMYKRLDEPFENTRGKK